MQEGDQAGNGSHRSGQQGRQDRGIQPSDPVRALQPGQVKEACSQALKMSATGESSRSIAVELALLFLRELVPTVAEDPERLVSTEAVLSFAAVRRGDPVTWQRWRRILEKYEKADLIEHMLGAPVPMDSGDGESAADRLISLVLDSGIELFHDPRPARLGLLSRRWPLGEPSRSLPPVPAVPSADLLPGDRQESRRASRPRHARTVGSKSPV